MKQYLLSVHTVDGDPVRGPEETEEVYAAVNVVNEEMQAAGAWVFAGGLYPPDTATVVRAGGDDVLVTDGPFVDGKEHIGGVWVIAAADLDEAMTWAAKATRACREPVEVRPFQEMPEL